MTFQPSAVASFGTAPTGRVLNDFHSIDCAVTDTTCTYRVPIYTTPFLEIPPANQPNFQACSWCDDIASTYVCEAIMLNSEKTMTATFN
jgi:hypothetical protein